MQNKSSQSANDVLVQLEEHTTPKFFFSLLAIHRGKYSFRICFKCWCWQVQGQWCKTDTQPDAPSRTPCHWHLCMTVTPSCTCPATVGAMSVLNMDVGHFSSQKLQLTRNATAASTWVRVVGHLLCLCQCMLNHIPVSYTHLTLPTIYSV